MTAKNKFNLLKQYLSHLLSYEFNYPLERPSEINFQITNRCPLNCKMCNIPVEEEDEEKILTAEEIKQALTEIKQWAGSDRYVSFVGGEALVREEVTLEAIKHANKLGFHTSLVTSGFLINKRLCQQLMDAGIDRVSVSVDGPNPEVHDEVRGEGSFKKALTAIRDFNDLRKDSKPPQGLKLDMNTIIMSDNFRHLPEVHELALEEDIDELFLQSVVPDNRYQHTDYNSEVWIEESDLAELKAVIRQLIALKKKHQLISNSLKYLEEVPLYFENKQQYDGGKCLAGYMNLNIAPDGKITICGFGPDINIRQGNIKELWKSKEFKKTRERIKHCDRPCMMLCYRKSSIKELINQLRG